MKIGNILLFITGILTIISAIISGILAINYMEHTNLFQNLILTFAASGISFLYLYAIKNEN